MRETHVDLMDILINCCRNALKLHTATVLHTTLFTYQTTIKKKKYTLLSLVIFVVFSFSFLDTIEINKIKNKNVVWDNDKIFTQNGSAFFNGILLYSRLNHN